MSCLEDITGLASSSRLLEIDALTAAVRALATLADQRTIAVTFVNDQPGRQQYSSQLPYDPAAVFLLETMISITRKTPAFIEDTWCVSPAPAIMQSIESLV
jgi:golgi-specific brefeldin A-resistance guanine nucleotide exchange factor 1